MNSTTSLVVLGIAQNRMIKSCRVIHFLQLVGIYGRTEVRQEVVKDNIYKAIISLLRTKRLVFQISTKERTGRMINNNLELLFNGPSLRSFNFTFKLRPRSEIRV